MLDRFLILSGLARSRPGPLGLLARSVLRSTPVLGAFPFLFGGVVPALAYGAWRRKDRLRVRLIARAPRALGA